MKNKRKCPHLKDFEEVDVLKADLETQAAWNFLAMPSAEAILNTPVHSEAGEQGTV